MGEPAYDLIHNPDSILILSVIHTEGGMGDADLKNTCEKVEMGAILNAQVRHFIRKLVACCRHALCDL